MATDAPFIHDGITIWKDGQLHIQVTWENRALSKIWDMADWKNESADYWSSYWDTHWRVCEREIAKAMRAWQQTG